MLVIKNAACVSVCEPITYIFPILWHILETEIYVTHEKNKKNVEIVELKWKKHREIKEIMGSKVVAVTLS